MSNHPGSITARLLAAGFRRNNDPADEVGECGAAPGYCVRLARWEHPVRRTAACAQHSLQELALEDNVSDYYRKRREAVMATRR